VDSDGRPIWRLIDSGIVSPEFSAASDEAITDALLVGSVPDTLHFYVRDSPTISIGHNRSLQRSVFQEEVARRGVRIVRRLSGGSAVYTDRGQLIFALALHDSLLPPDVVESYAAICGALIRGLSTIGVKAEYKPVNDILVAGRKVSGSAQLRRGGIVLHHGTMLVDTDLEALAAVLRPVVSEKEVGSVAARPVTCLREILGKAPDMQDVKRALARGISETFGVTLNPQNLTPSEMSDIENLVREKYGSREWNWSL
jgi:lipoate-protein ligase A